MNERESALEAMAALVGEWTMESPRFPGFRGRMKIERIEDGAYLAIRDVGDSDFPSSTWFVGGDDASSECAAHYSDSRGVRRVYRMTIVDGVWTIWRSAPEFNQRFTRRLQGGGRTIVGKWEMSADGQQWSKDFDLVYRRVV